VTPEEMHGHSVDWLMYAIVTTVSGNGGIWLLPGRYSVFAPPTCNGSKHVLTQRARRLFYASS